MCFLSCVDEDSDDDDDSEMTIDDDDDSETNGRGRRTADDSNDDDGSKDVGTTELCYILITCDVDPCGLTSNETSELKDLYNITCNGGE